MVFYSLTLSLTYALVALSQAARPEVKCPVPVSPLHGQIFMTRTGTAVKYSCNPGFELQGVQIRICKDDLWYPEMPTCSPVKSEQERGGKDYVRSPISASTPRPLFKWDDAATNSTAQSDEARVRMLLYPRGTVRSAASLAEEQRKRSSIKQSTLAPGVIYIRRPQETGKSWSYYHSGAPLHVALSNGEINGEGHEEALRRYYWASEHARRPLTEYRAGQPLSMTLSESQWAWINSLHPQLRDRYLKDLYEVKATEVKYLTYPDSYQWASSNPYYVRQPLTVVAENPVSVLDYSCHRTERDGRIITIKAPKLPNAHLQRYDRRQNPSHPYNDYLAAKYRCKAGYTLLDSRVNELYCSRSTWIGTRPACVQKI